MFNNCSPVIIVEPATIETGKLKNMIPVVKAEELIQINSLFYLIKTYKKSTKKYQI
jgi:hypothetical protein